MGLSPGDGWVFPFWSRSGTQRRSCFLEVGLTKAASAHTQQRVTQCRQHCPVSASPSLTLSITSFPTTDSSSVLLSLPYFFFFYNLTMTLGCLPVCIFSDRKWVVTLCSVNGCVFSFSRCFTVLFENNFLTVPLHMWDLSSLTRH